MRRARVGCGSCRAEGGGFGGRAVRSRRDEAGVYAEEGGGEGSVREECTFIVLIELMDDEPPLLNICNVFVLIALKIHFPSLPSISPPNHFLDLAHN